MPTPPTQHILPKALPIALTLIKPASTITVANWLAKKPLVAAWIGRISPVAGWGWLAGVFELSLELLG